MDDERLMSDDAVEDAVLRYLDESPEIVSGMAPSRDLWPDIEARIGARVLPLGRDSVEVHRVHRMGRRPAWLATAAAAAFLVASTAGVTYVLTKRFVPPGAATPTSQVATSSSTPTSSAPATAAPATAAPSTDAPAADAPAQLASAAPASDDVGSRTARTASSSASRDAVEPKESYDAPRTAPSGGSRGATTTLAHYPARLSDEARVTYDDEITRLHDVLEGRRDQLDPTTVATVERNLHIIDDAIAQARAALAKDPHSQMLNEQLDRTLAKKTQLLRAATLLPSV